VIKMVESLRHGLLPKTLHLTERSSKVDWSAGSLDLLAEARAWPEVGRPWRAGVSSFGISGTNAHVILEQAPVAEAEGTPPAVVPWVLSARTRPALAAQAERLLRRVSAEPDWRAADVGATLAERAPFEHRAVVTGEDRAELLTALESVVDVDVRPGGLAILFSGQGAQRIGMGRELHAAFPAFREAWDVVEGAICRQMAPGKTTQSVDRLRDVAWGEDQDALNRTEFAQPALFAFETALFRLVESWGVRPGYVAGHSVGEITAAHVAGVLSLEDACALVVARGRLMQALPETGSMVAVRANELDVTPFLTDGVDIAAVNGPDSLVLSGETAAVDEVVARLGVKAKRLEASHAFHSVLMEPMLDDFRVVAQSLSFGEPSIPVVSTVSGDVADLASPDYWVRQVRSAVRFADAVGFLRAEGVTTYCELGPDAVLSAMGPDSDPDGAFVPAQRRDTGEAVTLVGALGALHVNGADVDWRGYFAGSGARRVNLPTYPFEHQRYWRVARTESAGTHPWLHTAVTLPHSGEVVLTGEISADGEPWLAATLPNDAFVELAMWAGDQAGCDVLIELAVDAPLALPDHGAVRLQVVVGTDTDGRRTVHVYARLTDEQPWVTHATGVLGIGDGDAFDLTEWPPPGTTASEEPGARAAWRRGDEMFAEVEIADDVNGFLVHPALFQAVTGLPGDGLVPVAWEGVRVHAGGVAELRVRTDGETVRAADRLGRPVLSIGRVSRSLRADPDRPVLTEVPSAPEDDLRTRLAELDEAGRAAVLLDVVRDTAAAVLGHTEDADIGYDRKFLELGFDSLAVVHLCRRLGQVTGQRVTASVVFDHPTVRELGTHLGLRFDPAGDALRSVLGEANRLAAALSASTVDDEGRAEVTRRLTELLRAWQEPVAVLGEATDDELFRILDTELGSA
jgi:acyl transferase domain-containing protein